MISREKQEQLAKLMEDLGVREEDLEEKFIRASGHGGQKVNKTSSCVWLRHRPSGLEVKCQQDRSQSVNRHLARLELCRKLHERRTLAAQRRRAAAARRRRKNRRPSKAANERRLTLKKRRSERKSLRRRPNTSD